MKKLISARLDNVSESATLALNAAVQEMKSKGVDIVNLSAGEPDFSPPEEAKNAVIEAVQKNLSKYTPAPGTQELRSLIAKKTNLQQKEIKSEWTQSNVVVSNGGKQALFNAFLALINPGDKVLIPSPFWISYPEMVKLAGGVPVLVKTKFSNGFKMSPSELETALLENEGVKLLILTSPNNPTGSMYSKEEYSEIGKVLSENKKAESVFVVSDEIYDRIVLSEKKFCSFLDACPNLQDRTVTVNGLSKSAAMTGWRIGWTVSNQEIAKAIITLQGQSTSGVNALSQSAAVAALKIEESNFDWQIEKYKNRKELAMNILTSISDLKILNPDGAFYLFIGVGSYFRNGEDSISFSERLLKEGKVAVVPGTPFGEKEFIRISFATDEASLVEGCKRLKEFLSKKD